MKILVTGGAGFIGSHFIRHLLQKHQDILVINLDALTYAGNLENLKDLNHDTRLKFIKGDVCDEKCIKDLFQEYNPDYVVHFAAESHVDRALVDPKAFIKTNINGTHVLLETLRNFSIKRFIQVSTDEVYGSTNARKPSFSEEDALKPTNPYAASKAAADLLCTSYRQTYDLPIIITRCVNNYGSHQFPEKLIPVVIQQAMKNQKIPVYGKGQNQRSWIHVQDHCNALELILQKGVSGATYNISAQEEWANIELVKHILDIMNKSHELIEFVADRKTHDLAYALQTKKIENELDWSPTMKLSDGLPSVIQWYLDHQEWVQTCK